MTTTKLDLGTVGTMVPPGEDDLVALADRLGYRTVWLPGGPLQGLDQVTAALDASRHARVATGILGVDRFDADQAAALYHQLEASHPGRFVLGLGGAHGPHPLATLGDYLDRLDDAGVPAGRRALAALGPRMLDLARDRAAAAYPVVVTPAYTEVARRRLGDGTALAVAQLVLVEADAARAREVARRGPLGFLTQAPAYRANLVRQGFTEAEVDGLDDRLVDGLVAWGDPDRIAAHVRRHLDAGADHVAVTMTVDDDPAQWSALAPALGLTPSPR